MLQKTFPRAIVIVGATTALAVAQTNPVAVTPTTPPGAQAVIGSPSVGSIGGFTSRPLNAVTGQPFSAQEETETVQTLADGTHITNGTQKVMYYRDSLGRTRTERTTAQPAGFLSASVPTPPVFIAIADPVGGYRYSFDSNSHTAHRSPFGPRESVKAPALGSTASASVDVSGRRVIVPSNAKGGVVPANGDNVQRPRPEISRENLGTQTIEGVLAEGTRVTTTYPIGFLGNDRPLTTVTETWVSPEIGMTVLTKTSDPRRGESTMKLRNISRAEPDPSLFQPPTGYEIVGPEGAPPVPPPPPTVR